jgi:hypothetical protein
MKAERIRELAEQAWKEILDETSIDGDINTMFSADEVVAFEQKFAELIVRECMAVAVEYQNVGGNCYVDNRIAKHFGVEE